MRMSQSTADQAAARSLRRRQFKALDALQLFAGACMMGIPIAFTEEVWMLGETLPLGRVVLIWLVSVFTLAVFVHSLFYPEGISGHRQDFTLRVALAYTVTFLVAMSLLILIDKGPLDGALLAAKRAVLIAFPASFAAAAVDYLK